MLISKLVALSAEKYYVVLMEIQLKMCRFHGSLIQKGSRPLVYRIFYYSENLNLAAQPARWT